MRNLHLSLGIIILFFGVIVFSVSNQFTETDFIEVEGSRVENAPYGEWETSAQFAGGERLFVAFAMPNMEFVPNGEQVSATIWVSIIDPEGGNTTLRVDFKNPSAPRLNVTLESKADGLTVGELRGGFYGAPPDIGGVAKYAGNYTAIVYTFGIAMAEAYYYRPDGKLPRLAFWVFVRTYPYGVFLPVGVVLIVGGASLSVWAAKTSKRPSRRSSKRR
ncbi:hypothetical protein E3J49_08115 [Candidatus Bathyarchaeota archaeon]|nr:MAG: hypothetical protein E3J49_08115 [Candidatus Bathyarchaeota archaeon]